MKLQAFPEIYRSAVSCFKETLVKDGVVRGLYAGTLPALAANVADNAVAFFVLPSCQKVVASIANVPETKDLTPVQHGYAGFLAGIFTSAVLCPTELVKCQVQSLREMASINTETIREA